MNYEVVKGCTGKTAHATPKAAAVELKRQNGPRMGIYKCPNCSSYHVGHKVGGRTAVPIKRLIREKS